MNKRRRRSFGAEIELNIITRTSIKTIKELLSLSKEIYGSSHPQINPWR
jgi:hypothetical protein